MAPFSFTRNLLLVALVQIAANVASAEVPCTGFGCTEDESQDNANMLEDPTASACAGEGETELRFEITLDDKPAETSWYLLCDDVATGEMATLLNKPRGSLTEPKQAIEETACISATSTCAFSIVDSEGDGLDFGGYSLTFGDDLIDLYDTKPFADKSYCIGQLCAPSLQKAALDMLLEDGPTQEKLEKMVAQVVDTVIFDSNPEVAMFFDDDDLSPSLDESIGTPVSQKRKSGSQFISEGSTGDISLEAGAYAVIGVACLMGLIVTVAACIMKSGHSTRASSSAVQDALAPAKSGDADDADTFQSEEDEPKV